MTTIFPKSLLQHLRNSQTSKCKSLLITSTPPQQFRNNLSSYQTQINQKVEKTKFEIGMQHNIPIISSTIASAYPTSEAIASTIELAKRSGATSRIMGIGSRAAIDLAKSVTMALNSRESNVEEVILIPTTVGGVMASAMEDVLVYHVQEEGLCLPSGLMSPLFPTSGGLTTSFNTKKTVIAPGNTKLNSDIIMKNSLEKKDEEKMKGDAHKQQQASPSMQEASHAILAICIDAAISLHTTAKSENRNTTLVATIQELLEDTILNAILVLNPSQINADTNDRCLLAQQQFLTKALLQSGLLLNYTKKLFENDQIKRPVSLAISSALLPPYFPQVNMLTLISSLVPAMSKVYSSSDYSEAQLYLDPIHKFLFSKQNKLDPPSLASMMETRSQPNIETMLDSINSNLILWDHYQDEQESTLEEVLQNSLNR